MLLWPFIALMIINLPLFLNKTLPFVDTFTSFQGVYFFYNEFFLTGKIAQWMPFGAYGIQSDFLLITALSPASYFVGFMGRMFGVQDVYLLFKAVLFFEQVILLFGTYLLAKSVFKNRITILFVCLNVLGAISLIYNIYFSFRMFYLLPLIIYFLVLFFRDYRPQHLFIAMTIFVLQCIGNLQYMMVIPFYVLLIIFTVLAIKNYKNLHKTTELFRENAFSCFLSFFSFCIIAFAYLYFIKSALNEALLVTPDRAADGIVPIESFLTYGLNTKILTDLIFPFYSASGFLSSVNIFYGILPLFFLRYALREKGFNPLKLSLLLAIGTLVLLSIGKYGCIGYILYYIFPGMKYYRHISNVLGPLKLLLPIVSGFGLEYFLRQNTQGHSSGKISLMEMLFLVSGLIYLAAHIAGVHYLNEKGALALDATVQTSYILCYSAAVVVLFALLKRIKMKYPAIFLSAAVILIICFEMLSLQFLVNLPYYYKSKDVPLEDVSRVHGYRFGNERTFQPSEDRSVKAMAAIFSLDPNLPVYSYNFAQFDPCVYSFMAPSDKWALSGIKTGDIRNSRIDIINANVVSLIAERSRKYLFTDLNDALGIFYDGSCATPKLRLLSNEFYRNKSGLTDVRWVNNKLEFKSKLDDNISDLLNTDKINETLLLTLPAGLSEDARARFEEGNKTGKGAIKVTDFTANELDLETNLPEGFTSWLLYTDAYHPMWKAYINDRPAVVAQANIAFKAVKLQGGTSRVKFIFDNKYGRYCVYVFVVYSIIFMLLIVAGFSWFLLKSIVQAKKIGRNKELDGK